MKYKIDNLILFGGSRLLADFAQFAKKNLPYKLVVFSSKRHLSELIPGSRQTLRQILTKSRIQFFDSPDINQDMNLKRVVNKTSLGIAFGAAWIFERKTAKIFSKNYLLDQIGRAHV